MEIFVITLENGACAIVPLKNRDQALGYALIFEFKNNSKLARID